MRIKLLTHQVKQGNAHDIHFGERVNSKTAQSKLYLRELQGLGHIAHNIAKLKIDAVTLASDPNEWPETTSHWTA